jgi:Mu transposase, C-terminal
VPRDYTDLKALQVLCGDHSERDVTVLLPDNSIIRPWLTVWYDLRTGLIWGWCLCLVPSSFTAGLAYANGVQNFGAQPLSRPTDGFYSYIYTDHGRDYKSHSWNGKDIVVHKEAMRIDGGLEMLLTQRRVGILDELAIKHLLPRGRNPKERSVERVFKDISAWEQNTFQEYCGRHPKDRPERWYKLFAQHQQFLKGKRTSSPFIAFDKYREALTEFIIRYNSTEHERPTLCSARVSPIEEYRRLYTTRYEVTPETLALLLMKPEKRIIRKNGVQCFQKHWFYLHEAMSIYKGRSVEVRYSDDNYKSVQVILPNMKMCEAQLITPTSLLNPNKETLKLIKNARANERKIMREFDLITQSQLRCETVEDRVVQMQESEETEDFDENASEDVGAKTSSVHQLIRLDHIKPVVTSKQEVTSIKVKEATADTSIFTDHEDTKIKEFDYDN